MDFPDFNVVSLTNFGGLLCIVAYTVIKGDKSNLGDAASSFLGGTGIVGGGYLCLISLNKFACESSGPGRPPHIRLFGRSRSAMDIGGRSQGKTEKMSR